MGLPAWRVEHAEDFGPTLLLALDLDVPTLTEVLVEHTENMRLSSPPGQ